VRFLVRFVRFFVCFCTINNGLQSMQVMAERGNLEKLRNVSPLTFDWQLSCNAPVATMVGPGDVIISDSRHAHWPYSPFTVDSDCTEAQPCPGRLGLTFMMNAPIPRANGTFNFVDLPNHDGSTLGTVRTERTWRRGALAFGS
jgi:hypothetical protein